MIPRQPRPLRKLCDCGQGQLRWESLRVDGQTRWLATCSWSDCGVIETRLADGPDDPDGLRAFLLGNMPAQAHIQPWVRFFLRYQCAEVSWTATGEPCPDCNGSLVMGATLPWSPQRAADPLRAELCLDCGSLLCRFWIAGDTTELHMPADAWNRMPIQLAALKRAIADRCAHDASADDGDEHPWDFG